MKVNVNEPERSKRLLLFHQDCCPLAKLFVSAFVRLSGEQAYHAAPGEPLSEEKWGKNVTVERKRKR